ncbi:hypothetical protein JCM11641_005165 [Rhodosporidiobolus odoratus]
MPTDLRQPPSPRPRPPPREQHHLSPLRVFLICFTAALYAIAAIRWNLPPSNWIESWSHSGLTKVELQRPALRGAERYDAKHRYRPAASPVITSVGADGKVRLKGQYH